MKSAVGRVLSRNRPVRTAPCAFAPTAAQAVSWGSYRPNDSRIEVDAGACAMSTEILANYVRNMAASMAVVGLSTHTLK
jgi:hypothetical protein